MTRRLLPLAIVLVATVILAFAVSGFVREVIVVPVLYAGWFVWLMLTNLPHWVFWGLLILVALMLAGRSLRGTKRDGPDAKPSSTSAQGPVSAWSERLESASSRQTSQWRVSRDLGHIFWETRYPDEPFQMQRFLDRIDEPSMAMPPEIRAYFEAGLSRPQPDFRPWFLGRRRTSPSPLDLDPAVAVQFLEETFDLFSADPVSTESVFTDPTGGKA